MSITSKQELRAFFGEPGERARKKEIAQLDVHCRNFIALSPFLVIGSARPDGTDVSPKGDAPGFVAVLDDKTLVIPDRPGNNRVDTMQNILESPHVGLIFFVPGIKETLRVNGRASITIDPELLGPLAVKGKVPRTGLVVKVDEAFLHCPKALIRSDLWNPEAHAPPGSFPSIGQVIADQIGIKVTPEDEKAHRQQQLDTLY